MLSFGTNYEFMYPDLVPSTQQKTTEACDAISQFDAKLGDSEIYSALTAIFYSSSPPLPAQVFLLTNGDVHNPNSVVELVRANCEDFTLHTIGVGDAANTELIVECARAGKGKHFFVGHYCDEFEGKFVDAM